MTIKELAQRYAEKPTEARYEVLRDAVLDMELQEIKAEIEQVKDVMNEEIIDHDRKDLINFVNGLNQALIVIDNHINVNENNNTEYQSARALDISSVEVACKTWMNGKENGNDKRRNH